MLEGTSMPSNADRPNVGIIGNGHVGSALEKGLSQAGYEVKSTGREPGKVRQVGQWADLVVLAVPYGERQNAVQELGASIDDKTVVDVTNALGGNMEFQGSLEQSGAEELQEWLPDSRVVKAFNTVFAKHMDKGAASNGQPLTLFVAGDDEAAKREVLDLGDALGFDALDAGPLENARWLEPLGYLNIALGYKTDLGDGGGFHYVHAGSKPRHGSRPRKGGRGRVTREAPEAAKAR
jgi:predicted dinucleotide-binding enzyme